MDKLNVLENEKTRNKYLGVIFTENGEKTLMRYLEHLVGFYMNPNREYPFKIGIIFGIPLFKWANLIDSKEDLFGRIKAYAQILGIDEINTKKGSSMITLKLKGVDEK